MSDMRNEGKMDRVRGRVRSLWGDVTDDEVAQSEGDLERLVGTIKEKTGDSIETIKEKLRDLFDDDEVKPRDYR